MKENPMKKRKVLFLSVLLLMSISRVHAASVTLGRSSTTITKGSRVTIYVNINNAASWQLTGNGTGSTSGCSLGEAGTGYSQNGENTSKTLTVTCYSTDVGSIGFTVTGVIGYMENGSMKKMNVSQGTSVSVVKPRDPDSNNYLSSLSVEGYELTPAFDKDTLEYSVSVPSSIDKVTIAATKASGYASDPTGVGEKEVSEGSNKIEVTVKSETGVDRTYVININVEDKNPITIKIEDESYTVMKNLKDMKIPDGFQQESIKIKELDIPALVNKKLNMTLVGIKDSKGNKLLAVYNKDDTYQLFNQNSSKSLSLFIIKPETILEGFHEGNITIQGTVYSCLKHNEDENYIVIYAQDLSTGEKKYYVYDVDTSSYILYKDGMQQSFKDQIEKYKTVVFGFAIALGVMGLIIVILLLRRPKRIKKQIEKENNVRIEKQEPTKKKETSNVKKEEVQPKEEPKKKTKKANSKTDAIETIKSAQEIIDEYEKTVSIPKEKLVSEDTEMYDILNDDKKSKRKKKS